MCVRGAEHERPNEINRRLEKHSDLADQEEQDEKDKLVRKTCAYCDGTGQQPGPLGMATPVRCSVCDGRGYHLLPEDWNRCRDCGGTGKRVPDMCLTWTYRKCGVCNGLGWRQSS